MRPNRRKLTKIAKAKKDNMIRYSTKYYKSDEYVLTVHKSKYQNIKIEGNAKRFPETILFYNQTKFGVDVADQMARKFSRKAGSRRWSPPVFYNILDLAAINAWILYKETARVIISSKKSIYQLPDKLGSDLRNKQNTSFNSLVVIQNLNVRKSCQIELC